MQPEQISAYQGRHNVRDSADQDARDKEREASPSEFIRDNAASGTRPKIGRRECSQPTTSPPINTPTGALSPMSAPRK